MRVQRTNRNWLMWTVALGIVTGISVTYVDVGARQADANGRLSADVTIRQVWVDKNGQALPGAPPAQTYRLERSVATRGWRTELSLVAMERPAVQTTADAPTVGDPFVITRMVHDDRRGLRLFNRRGDEVRGPDASDRRLLRETGAVPDSGDDVRLPTPGLEPPTATSVGWASRLVVTRAGRAERADRLRAVFGLPVGQVAGLDRYVASHANGMSEVLVDPQAALPVEINVVRGGALVVRTRIVYDAIGSELLVRRRALSERAVPGERGERVVTDVELSNVEVPGGVQ